MRLRLFAVMVPLFLLACAPAFARSPVFDAHVHLHELEASLQRYQADATAAKLQVDGMAAMWFGGPHQARQGDTAAIRAGNDSVIALARMHSAVVAVATVHPYDGQAALDELARIAAAGVKVLKLHPHTQRFDAADARVLSLVKAAGAHGMVVLLDNAGILPGDSERLFNLALQAPKTRFIFAHLGGLGFRFWNTLALARTAERLFADNVYFDISGLVVLAADSPLEPEFVWTLRNVGTDHVVLGSDYPQFSLAAAVDALERLDLSDAEKARIRVENARRLFGR